MRNKNYTWLAVGAILFALVIVAVYWQKITPDEKTENVVYGTVSLPEAISQFVAEGENGMVTIKPDKGVEQMPVGEYRSRLWRTEREDDQDNTWVLTGQSFANESLFEVNDSKQTKLDIGEPIIATVDARKSGSNYSFNQIIKGRLDEHIELTRNGARPRAPKLNIKNNDGTYNRTFSFEYG